MNNSKSYLLECATAEAVLRLDRTLLHEEAIEIQTKYLVEQNHETLLQYMEESLAGAATSQWLQVWSPNQTLTSNTWYK